MKEGRLHFKLCKTPNLWHNTWDIVYICFLVKELDMFGHYFPKESEYGLGYTLQQSYNEWRKVDERNRKSI